MSTTTRQRHATSRGPYETWKPVSHLAGFTIIELIIVVAVIAILVAITVVSYTAVITSAHTKELNNAAIDIAKELRAQKASQGVYPSDLTGLTTQADVTYTYSRLSSQGFCVAVSRYGITVHTTDSNTEPVSGPCSDLGADVPSCPSGFVVVPGNTALGTAAFCIMKYEAKNVGGVATSQAAGTPWVSISQADASNTAKAACSGCHLMTDAEWMAVAADIISTGSNWSGGVVGSGTLYIGHNDNSPAVSLAAGIDTDGYNGTGNSAGSGANQRRTFTLSNGQVIWDLSGNVWEWVTDSVGPGNQPGTPADSSYVFRDWNNNAILLNGLPYSSTPKSLSAVPALTSINNWNMTNNGIGSILSNYNETARRPFLRGGGRDNGGAAGILTLALSVDSSLLSTNVGFRVAK